MLELNLRAMGQADLGRLPLAALTEERTRTLAARRSVLNTLDRINTAAAGRALTANQQRDYDTATGELTEHDHWLEELDHLIAGAGVDRSPLGGFAHPGAFREGQPLAREQRMADYAQARGLVSEELEGVGLRAFLAAYVTGDTGGDERVRNALSTSTIGTGGALVPTPLSTRIIDRARGESVIFRAGAQTVPMESGTLKFARVATDPTLAWHSENATISPSDPTLEQVTLTARSLAGIVQLSRELLEDAEGVDEQLEAILARVFALKVDQVALYGTGTAPEPRGVKNTTGITVRQLADAASFVAADLVTATGAVEANNYRPTAFVMAPRSATKLAGQNDSTGQPVSWPSYLDGIAPLSSSQVPTTLTVGANTDTSDVFTADWRQLFIGVRTQFSVEVLRERYADLGQVALLVWFRGDVLVADPKAFHVTTNVRP